jgi:hypothetical protein
MQQLEQRSLVGAFPGGTNVSNRNKLNVGIGFTLTLRRKRTIKKHPFVQILLWAGETLEENKTGFLRQGHPLAIRAARLP